MFQFRIYDPSKYLRMAKTIRTWLSASKSSTKNIEYSEETYIEIHNLLLQDSDDQDASGSELDAGKKIFASPQNTLL